MDPLRKLGGKNTVLIEAAAHNLRFDPEGSSRKLEANGFELVGNLGVQQQIILTTKVCSRSPDLCGLVPCRSCRRGSRQGHLYHHLRCGQLLLLCPASFLKSPCVNTVWPFALTRSLYPNFEVHVWTIEILGPGGLVTLE